ncbi:MAG: hypothetical protein NT105_19510 [Verrucomicrobia bacterium]|nr:hypothetical protein [Verrucomicrobiota bacterium]
MSKSKTTKAGLPDTNHKIFNFFWEHLRRNPRYREAWKEFNARNPDRRLMLEIAIAESCGLPAPPIDPDTTADNALKTLLARRSDYFNSDLWQKVLRRMEPAAAIWNRYGEHGCAWDYGPAERKPGDENPPEGTGETFHVLRLALKTSDSQENRKTMRDFLKAHSRMDFVLDTSLPWGTVAKELEKIFDGIKQLRKDAGLDEDEDPKRMSSKWQEQLAVYDAYLPTWQRRKAVREIGRKALGFKDAANLLGLRLTKQDLDLVKRMDAADRKPKDFFQLYDEHKKRAMLGGGWDEGLEHLARQHERRAKRRAVDFDDPPDAPLTAVLSKQAVRDLKAGHFGAVGEFLDGFRESLCVKRVPLPAPLDKLSRKNRNRCFHWAREKVEATWME